MKRKYQFLFALISVAKSSSFNLLGSSCTFRLETLKKDAKVRSHLPQYASLSTTLFESKDAAELKNNQVEITKSRKGDGSTLTDIVAKVYDNINSGEFGKRGEYFVVLQIVLVLCILYGNVPLLGDLITFILGPCLAVIGSVMIFLGIKDLGTNLSPWPTAPVSSSLVRKGIYSEVRHPIYAGLLYLCLGISVWSGSAMRCLITFALWYLLEKKSSYEENDLIEKFDDYEEYQLDVVGKFIPGRLAQAMSFVNKD